MKLKAKVSWLMETVQQGLFPHLDKCLPSPLTEPEKRLVKILELVQIEKHVPVSAKRQWLGRPLQEREAIARAFVAKAVLKYQHTSSLRNELLSAPNLRMICGFTQRQDVPSESTFSRSFAEEFRVRLGIPCQACKVANLPERIKESPFDTSINSMKFCALFCPPALLFVPSVDQGHRSGMGQTAP